MRSLRRTWRRLRRWFAQHVYPRGFYLKVDGYEAGWHDKVELLFDVSFQLLRDFVEREMAGEVINWDSDTEHREAWKTINDLYHWVTVIRPARVDPIDAYPRPKYAPRAAMWNDQGKPCAYSLVCLDSAEAQAAWTAAIRKSFELAVAWQAEDQRQLHRLIDVRNYLWT